MSRIDTDNRFRSSYAPYAATGRFRSSDTPLNTGSNGQNVDREARDIYIPDDGCIFLGVDLSTAEDRVTKVRSKSPRLIERAKLPPWEWDEHKYTGTQIFRVSEKEINYTQRYLAKRGRHATNYGVMGQRLSDELLKEGFITTGEEMQAIIDGILHLDPELLDYQRDVRRKLMATHKLTNAWGRTIDYSYERMDDELYRRGYAFLPQSDIGDLMNMWGFKPLAQMIQLIKEQSLTRINQHGHDSLLISVDPMEAYTTAVFLQRSLERPVNYSGIELVIPTEFSLGTTWKFEKEFKRLPSRKEFTAIAVELWEKMYNQSYTHRMIMTGAIT